MCTAVDVQSRLTPAAVRAGELLSAGVIGRILSASVLSHPAGFGRGIPEATRPLADPAVGRAAGTAAWRGAGCRVHAPKRGCSVDADC